MKTARNSPKRHHFVPRFYLEQFADAKGFLHILDLKRRQSRTQRPSQVMRINAYYRQTWAPPGVDPDIMETRLGAGIEVKAKDVLARLMQATPELTDDHSATLVNYLELQRIRVPRQGEAAKALMRETILKLSPPNTAAAIRTGKFQLTMKDSARFDFMSMILGVFYPWFSRMEWEVVEAEQGSAFITTDSPVSFFNPECPPPAEAGIGLAGTKVFFPLSSRKLLLLRHPECRTAWPLTELAKPSGCDTVVPLTYGGVWNRRLVAATNWRIARLADHLVVAKSNAILAECELDSWLPARECAHQSV